MNKKLVLISVLFLVVAIFAVFALATNQKDLIDQTADTQNLIQQENQDLVQEANETIPILFYGDGCPHCVIVEEYVAEKNIESAVPFVKKEVYYNRQNADDLVAKAKACGMPTNSIGVPFLWDGSKCLVGDQDIIEFFKTKAGI